MEKERGENVQVQGEENESRERKLQKKFEKENFDIVIIAK
jgi:hypothetical protein